MDEPTELGGADLGDPRRDARLVRVATILAKHPDASLPEACPTGADLKGADRFFANPSVAPERILARHLAASCQRLAEEPLVLAVQDATLLDYTDHPQTEVLGPLGNPETQGLVVHGTLAYMPPEQAMGGEVTPRSDLYSLGAMLYEMVCGRPPFVGDERVAIITQHLNTPPVSPSWHNPVLPPGLEALILRLLEKDPAKRPASAGEVQAALEAIAAGLGRAGAINRAPTPGVGTGSSLSRLGEGQGALKRGDFPPSVVPRAAWTGEGEPQAGVGPRAAADLRAEALQHLDFAIAEFREMKMRPSLERALRHKDVLRA